MTRYERWTAGLLGLALTVSGAAQDLLHAARPLPSYEVATVKRAGPDTPRASTMMQYIQQAFNVPAKVNVRVIGGPAWLTTEEYVIQGKPSQEMRDAMEKMNRDQRQEQTRLLQQGLLAERFKLRVHFEMREMQVFELVVAKGGVKMKEAAAPAASSGTMTAVGLPPIPPPDKFSQKTLPSGVLAARIQRENMELFGNSVPMRAMVNGMVNFPEIAGRPVVDKTGMKGLYTFTMTWAAPPGMGMGQALPGDPAGASLFTAIKEQLGLELVAKKEPVEVVMIDSMERPTGN